MSTQHDGNARFKLVQMDGYSEHELFETNDIQEMLEYVEQKGGLR